VHQVEHVALANNEARGLKAIVLPVFDSRLIALLRCEQVEEGGHSAAALCKITGVDLLGGVVE
jgi:hypothetical protein